MTQKHHFPADITPAVAVDDDRIKLFLRHLANAGKAKGTLRRYNETLTLFLGYFDHQDPAAITTDMLDEFLEDLRVRRSPATVNMMKSAVRSFYRYLLDGEKIVKDPSRLIKNEKVVRKSPGIFSEVLLRSFLKAIADAIGDPPRPGPMRDFMMFQMAYNTGLRVGELVAVDIEDVDGKRTLEVIGKGRKLDTVPLNSTVRSALRRYLSWRQSRKIKDGKALFVNRLGERITTRGVELQLTKWLKKAEIDAKFSPHSLRHTFGTNILRASRNIRTTQRLLRHANVTTTQIYTHVDDDESRSAVETLN